MQNSGIIAIAVALISAAVTIITLIANKQMKNRELTVDDGTGIRKSLQEQVQCLMNERTQLVAEIENLKKQIKRAEDEIRLLNDQILALKKQLFLAEETIASEKSLKAHFEFMKEQGLSDIEESENT